MEIKNRFLHRVFSYALEVAAIGKRKKSAGGVGSEEGTTTVETISTVKENRVFEERNFKNSKSKGKLIQRMKEIFDYLIHFFFNFQKQEKKKKSFSLLNLGCTIISTNIKIVN